MIESFEIETKVGNPNQVGLFFKAEPVDSASFLTGLRTNGYIPTRPMTSNRRGYNQFVYVSTGEKGLSKDALRDKLETFCKTQMSKTELAGGTTTYELWQKDFRQYIRDYRNQRFDPITSDRRVSFDKGQTYNLIKSKRYQEAERYLKSFVSREVPLLVPDYLLFLYESWGKPAEVVKVFELHRNHFYSNEVDHAVIEWLVAAFLQLTPPQAEQALGVLDDFLPEFQRQGVAETLLAYRTQARLLQGKLPQTLGEMHRFIESTSSEHLREQIDGLLDVITALVDPLPSILDLLNQLETKIVPHVVWKIDMARAQLARRHKNLENALEALRSALQRPDLDKDALRSASIQLDIAQLWLDLEQSDKALEEIDTLQMADFGLDEQRRFWGIRGLAELKSGNQAGALSALTQAYDLGERAQFLLQPLAQLAYQTEDWTLARQVYSSLLQSGFEPALEDLVYSGVLNWLGGELDIARNALQKAFVDPTWQEISAQLRALACQAYAESLKDPRTISKDVVPVYSAWIDALTELRDAEQALKLVGRLNGSELDHTILFALVEALEPLLNTQENSKKYLIELYAQWLITEIDRALRYKVQLPDWTVDLQMALFTLDRAQFNFVRDYMKSELIEARRAQLVQEDYHLGLSQESRPALDLKNRSIALIGGYEPMRKRVKVLLTNQFKLSRFTEIPPSWEAHVDQEKVAEAVRDVDLIVVVHRCLKHDGTDALKAAIDGTNLSNVIRYAAGKGHSSVLRTIIEFFSEKTSQIS